MNDDKRKLLIEPIELKAMLFMAATKTAIIIGELAVDAKEGLVLSASDYRQEVEKYIDDLIQQTIERKINDA